MSYFYLNLVLGNCQGLFKIYDIYVPKPQFTVQQNCVFHTYIASLDTKM